jgi:hypothetical protein
MSFGAGWKEGEEKCRRIAEGEIVGVDQRPPAYVEQMMRRMTMEVLTVCVCVWRVDSGVRGGRALKVRQ